MSRISLDRIPGEDYYPSSADSFTIFVTLTHGEQVKFKLKFKTEEEVKRFLGGLTVNKNDAGEPTFTNDVKGKKVVLKTNTLSGDYANLQIESDSFLIYMALKKQYLKQMKRKLARVEEDYSHDDYQTLYIFK